METTLAIEIAKLQQSILESFLKRFPNAWIRFGTSNLRVINADESVLGNRFYVSFGVMRPECLPGKYQDNDISQHKMSVDMGDGEMDLLVGGHVYTKPVDKVMAMGKVKVGWRRKKGTPEQLAKHFDSYIAKLRAQVDTEIANDNLLVKSETIGI